MIIENLNTMTPHTFREQEWHTQNLRLILEEKLSE